MPSPCVDQVESRQTCSGPPCSCNGANFISDTPPPFSQSFFAADVLIWKEWKRNNGLETKLSGSKNSRKIFYFIDKRTQELVHWINHRLAKMEVIICAEMVSQHATLRSAKPNLWLQFSNAFYELWHHFDSLNRPISSRDSSAIRFLGFL